jgi:hypothetical protein
MIQLELEKKKNTFKFENVANENTTQEEIFQMVGAPIVDKCFEG